MLVFPHMRVRDPTISQEKWYKFKQLGLEICNKGKTWWCLVVGSADTRFRPPATGLKIARQAADVEQSARDGEAMAFLDDLKAGKGIELMYC